MVSIDYVRELSLSFPEATEQMHFDKPSFRVRKKIFATVHLNTKKVVLKLSLTDQSVFCAFDLSVIYPVPGSWGKQGWTIVELSKVKKAMFKDALTTAYCTVAPASLAAPFLPK